MIRVQTAALDRKTMIGVGTVGLAGLVAVASPSFLPHGSVGTIALAVFAMGLWATGAIPEHLTAIAFFLLAMVFKVASPHLVFSGFESGTIWLIFSGLVMGAAIRHTGLGNRIAGGVTAVIGHQYPGIIAAVVFVGVVLAFILPSSVGRAVLLMPIAVSLADRFGFASGSNGRTGIALAAAFGTHVPAFAILPSNVPNMILAGSSEAIYQIPFTYAHYLLLHFPVLGMLKAVALVALILYLFPDRVSAAPTSREAAPMSSEERRLLAVLTVALLLWFTDSVHGIAPAWIGLGAALYCLWPGSGLMARRAFNEELNFGSLFFVAGVMGLGTVLAASGVGSHLVNSLVSITGLSSGSPFLSFAVLTLIATALAAIVTLPGVPAIITPLAGGLAGVSGLAVKTVLMTQVLGFSTILLPYESPPLLVAMQLGNISLSSAAKLSLALFVVTLLLLLPLDALWWKWLGWL